MAEPANKYSVFSQFPLWVGERVGAQVGFITTAGFYHFSLSQPFQHANKSRRRCYDSFSPWGGVPTCVWSRIRRVSASSCSLWSCARRWKCCLIVFEWINSVPPVYCRRFVKLWAFDFSSQRNVWNVTSDVLLLQPEITPHTLYSSTNLPELLWWWFIDAGTGHNRFLSYWCWDLNKQVLGGNRPLVFLLVLEGMQLIITFISSLIVWSIKEKMSIIIPILLGLSKIQRLELIGKHFLMQQMIFWYCAEYKLLQVLFVLSSADSAVCLCVVVGVHIAHSHHWRSPAGHGDRAVLRCLRTNQRSGCHALLLSAEHLLQKGNSFSHCQSETGLL